jgi:hypothetical protein
MLTTGLNSVRSSVSASIRTHGGVPVRRAIFASALNESGCGATNPVHSDQRSWAEEIVQRQCAPEKNTAAKGMGKSSTMSLGLIGSSILKLSRVRVPYRAFCHRELGHLVCRRLRTSSSANSTADTGGRSMSYQPSHDIVSCVAKVRRRLPLSTHHIV